MIIAANLASEDVDWTMNQDNPYESPVGQDIFEAHISCSDCGEVCEQGLIHALGNISWFPVVKDFKIVQPERLTTKKLNLETKLRAIRCRNCDTITIELSSK